MKLSLLSAVFVSLTPLVKGQNLDGCIDPADFDPNVDLFPDKVEATESENWSISYHNYYKIITNKSSNVTYLLHQCGTEVSEELSQGHDAVITVPVQNGVGFTSTPQLPHLELLGVRNEIVTYIGNPAFLSSACLLDLIEDGQVTVVQNASDPVEVQESLFANNVTTPSAIFVAPGQTYPLLGGNEVIIEAYTETTNVAIFEWNKVYATFFNLEALSNEIFDETTERYDCVTENANILTSDAEMTKPTVLWGFYSTYSEGWSVASCPNYYCEYARDCSANLLTTTEGSVETDFGNLMTLEEFVEFGKDADMWIFPSGDWNDIFATYKDELEQFVSVQNEQVFDYLGGGQDRWFSDRFVEFDVVHQDFCSVAGTASAVPPIHQRQWFRNVFTEPAGSSPTCDDPNAPLETGASDCVLLPETLPQPGDETSSAKRTTIGMGVLAIVSLTVSMVL